MKRLTLLLAPLMILATLSSCSATPGYIVNSVEFDRAIHMKGVNYLQFSEDNGALTEFSPNGYYHVHFSEGEGGNEEYICKENNTYTKYFRESPTADFVITIVDESEFKSITDLVEEVLEPVKDKKFSDYHYHKDKQEYIVDFIDYWHCHTAIHFEKKKVDYIRFWYDEENKEAYAKINFTYAIKEVNPPII